MGGRFSGSIFSVLMVAACGLAPLSALAQLRNHDDARQSPDQLEQEVLCGVFGKCNTLFGQATGSAQPALANLLADIALILDAPERVWVHTRDRPPASITLRIAEVLRRCYQKLMTLKAFILHPCLAHADPATVPIVDSPIPWSANRERLMAQYMLTNTGDASTRLVNPSTVVLHWTDTPTYQSAYNTFEGETLNGRAGLAKAGNVNVSCHFVVDRDGTIHQLMPITRVARHAVGMNRNAICIENVGVAHRQRDGSLEALTDEQLRADEMLVQKLVAENPSIDNVIGHSEYRSFEDTYIFHELDPHYRSDRDSEPGKKFLARFRRDLFGAGEGLRASNRCTDSVARSKDGSALAGPGD